MSLVAGHLERATPGVTAAYETQEKNIVWDTGRGIVEAMKAQGWISGAARDAGNTPTTLLRPGLLLGKITSSGLLKEWNPTGTDGSQVVYGILSLGMYMQDIAASNTNRVSGTIIVGGPVKAANILMPGQSSWSIASGTIPYADLARSQMRGRFLFDDDLGNRNAFLGGPTEYVAKTADYSVLYTDAGKCFHTTGASAAVTFTLPTITNRSGMVVEFYNTVDFTMTVASAAADTMIAIGDSAASSVAFATAGQKIGGRIRCELLPDASKWLVSSYGPQPLTVTA